MKTDLVHIVKYQALLPGCNHWTDDDIIPTLIRHSRMIASASTAMEYQAPKVINIKAGADKPKALKLCQGIPIDLKANDSRMGCTLSL